MQGLFCYDSLLPSQESNHNMSKRNGYIPSATPLNIPPKTCRRMYHRFLWYFSKHLIGHLWFPVTCSLSALWAFVFNLLPSLHSPRRSLMLSASLQKSCFTGFLEYIISFTRLMQNSVDDWAELLLGQTNPLILFCDHAYPRFKANIGENFIFRRQQKWTHWTELLKGK